MKPYPNTLCPFCGGANQCAPAAAGTLDAECWCTKVTISREALARVPPESLNRACLCPRCAGVVAAAHDAAPPSTGDRTRS